MASPDKKAFLLRLPPDVWAQLERLAASELRSVNGPIEYLLREGLARRITAAPRAEDDSGEPASDRERTSRTTKSRRGK